MRTRRISGIWHAPRGKRKFGILVAGLAATALFAGACGEGAQGTSGGGGPASYKIGALLGLTGSYSALGTNEQKALQLFADRVNSSGGVNGHKIELVFADTTSSESEAVNQLRKLATQDDVIAVIGPSSSGEGVAIKPISASLKVPVIVPASSKDIVTPLDQAKYAFKEFPASDASLQAQLTYAKDQGWRKIAILASNNGYGQEPVAALPGLVSQYGLELVASETFPPTATDVTAQLSSIAGKNPDVVLVWAVNPANAIVAKNARNINFKPVLFNSPGAASPDYIKVGGQAVEGTLVQGSMVAVPGDIKPDNPQYQAVSEFAKAWRDAYNSEPNQYAANGWDCMLLLRTALEKGNVGTGDVTGARNKLQAALESTIKDVPGINAVYSFSATQHGPEGIKGLAVLKVDGGAWKLIKAY
ncbi:MAG: ABC transporter substrate-binding protein [Microbispora sp.]|nr:ABC transporter substrate-binding protein [Microbispora sp.]